jgi:glycosyltransferase involved in cell wall biosynthesis
MGPSGMRRETRIEARMTKMAERPPIANAPLSLVLVSSNAAADLEAVALAWITELETLHRSWEIILVDDGSTDDTPMRADILAARNDRLRVVHHAMRQGFGAALRSGIDEAKYPLLAYTTCDRQYEPAELKRLLEQIDKVDLVTGCRLWMPVPRLARWLGKILRIVVRILFGIALEPLPSWLGDYGQRKRWLARWVFGVRIHDVECAFRLLRRSVLARLPLQSNGPFAQVEMLAKANFLGCWMAEVPVTYRPPLDNVLSQPLSSKHSYLAEARRLFHEPAFGK